MKEKRDLRISFNTNPGNLNTNTGYGKAGYNVVKSLKSLGHEVFFKDAGAEVEIAMCMPDFSSWSSKSAYHIQYTPWESTELKPRWLEAFNGNCDEVWTTSPLIKEWYEQAGVTKPVYVYEHGIEKEWSPHRRRKHPDEPMRIIHMGEPASRKGGQEAYEAFKDVFGHDKNYQFIIKAWNRSNIREFDERGGIRGLPHQAQDNVTTVYNDYSLQEMVFFVRQQHVMIYNSWGEGFGFIPFEAMATGLPTIVPSSWAPYRKFILPELDLSSTLVDSPWPLEHPGKMYMPVYDDLVNKLEFIKNCDYDKLAGKAYKNSFMLHEEYDWDRITLSAWERIFEKFE